MGAGTLWELAAWKVPALVVPLIQGARGDQILNANYFQNLGACISLEDPEPENFLNQTLTLLENKQQLEKMSQSYEELPTNASNIIAQAIHEIIKQKEVEP